MPTLAVAPFRRRSCGPPPLSLPFTLCSASVSGMAMAEPPLLHTVRELREHGLQHVQKTYRLLVRRHAQYRHVVHLKYQQHASPMDQEVTRECRGLILDESQDWRPVAYPYRKFFNDHEQVPALVAVCVFMSADVSPLYLCVDGAARAVPAVRIQPGAHTHYGGGGNITYPAAEARSFPSSKPPTSSPISATAGATQCQRMPIVH